MLPQKPPFPTNGKLKQHHTSWNEQQNERQASEQKNPLHVFLEGCPRYVLPKQSAIQQGLQLSPSVSWPQSPAIALSTPLLTLMFGCRLRLESF